MKKFSLVSIAIAVLFAIPQLAFAQSEPFNFTGPTAPVFFDNQQYGTYLPGTITIAGTFQYSDPPNGQGGDQITNITGTYTDSTGVSGGISLYPGYGSAGAPAKSADGLWDYDNLYYPGANAPGTVGGEFDKSAGLLFYVGPVATPDEWEVNIWTNANGTSYSILESSTGGTWLNGATDILTQYSNTDGSLGGGLNGHVPEGSGLPMLALCGLGLACAFLFKTRQSGLFMKR